MTESLRIDGLDFAVTRSPRRTTVGITVGRDGGLGVAAPVGLAADRVEAAVRGKLLWVYTKLAGQALLFRAAAPKQYVSGEGFYYLGRSHRLLLTDPPADSTPARLRLTGGRFTLPRTARGQAAGLFARWYTDRATAWLGRRVDLIAPRVGGHPEAVRVRDLGHRWGSCTPGRVVNFHWRVVCLPPPLIEYVVAHELVHLAEPQHDAAFWARLERVLPDYRGRKRLLATDGGRY